MPEYSKYNIVYRLQKWMDSVPGQTFLNYAYSWGASIVILGTLFKLTHLPGANIMLFIGMGTEVFVFFISAFDRPFDKTDDGKKIPTRVTEEYLETGKVTYGAGYDNSDDAAQDENAATTDNGYEGATAAAAGQAPAASSEEAYAPHVAPAASTEEAFAPQSAPQPSSSAVQEAVADALKQQSQIITASQQSTPEMVEAQGKYVEALQNLTELLGKVGDQSERLTRDSEEMENLNRTLTGIAKIYELQLKGASRQVGTIDEINAQTRKMAEQIAQLNKIYARMIEAMTVNMRVAAPGAAQQFQGSDASQNGASHQG